MKIVFFLALLIISISSLPTTFDLRVLPTIIKYADYSFKPQGTCVAHSWGLQLAQILSNAVSLQLKSKIRLSSQHLIECISSKNEICHDASLQNIMAGIQYIQKTGLTTVDCIKNQLFTRPRQFCPRQCDNGYKFEYQFKGIFQSHTSFNQLLNTLTDDQQTAAFVIVKNYDSMNYYSSQNPQSINTITNQYYGYRVAEVVGWKNKGSDIVVRLGSGQGWGYNGFGYLNEQKHKSIIVGRYTVKANDVGGKRIIKLIQDDSVTQKDI